MLEKDGDSYQQKVIAPNLLRLVAPQKGMKKLDVACGQGFFSRLFFEHGASVAGCDISPELVDLAIEHSSPEIFYFVAPANDLQSVTSESRSPISFGDLDAVTIVLALQNIEDVQGTISECARALKKGGKLYIVLNHPVFRIPGSSSWQWDESSQRQYRRIDSYMSESKTKIDMTPSAIQKDDKKFTVTFHRPLQVYSKSLQKSGLTISRLEEWISHKKSQNGPRSSEEDRIRKEIPMFLCIEAIKN
jgi:ubiquinone/menaquinone biosynthesis C-methylase UbiE